MGVRGTAALAGALLVAAYGCAGTSTPQAGKPCMTNADCSATEQCRVNDRAGTHPAKLPLPNPCTALPACATTDDCSDGLTCLPSTTLGFESSQGCPAKVCAAPCTASTCKADEVCRSSGACELAPCDEPGAPVCAEHWRCDPSASVTEPTGVVAGAAETDVPVRAVARGCVRARCDEPDGFECREDWECAPPRSLEGTGCAAIPCVVLGHCSSDVAYICAPTGSGPRPDSDLSGGEDVFGCVLRNCEEGRACTFDYRGQALGYCNPSAPDADQFGCSVHTCLEVSNLCAPGSRCATADKNADRVGCALDCAEGAKCSTDWSSCVPL
jgi:hypothetical protein